MALLNILLFLAASLVYVNADATFGADKEGTELLVESTKSINADVTVIFDSKHNITIDKVVVSYNGATAYSVIVSGGPTHAGVTFDVSTRNTKAVIGVAIYGRWNGGVKNAIESSEIQFME